MVSSEDVRRAYGKISSTHRIADNTSQLTPLCVRSSSFFGFSLRADCSIVAGAVILHLRRRWDVVHQQANCIDPV